MTQSSCIITVSVPSGIGAPVKMRIASPRRCRQQHHLFADHRRDPRLDQRERRVDAEQRAAEGKAIVAQLRHGASPRWSEMNAATAPGSPSGNSGIGAAIGSSEAIATTCGSSG
jgi:hypothetical protein